MKRLFLVLTLTLSLAGICPMNAQSITIADSLVMELDELIALGLTTVVVETVDGEEPTCDYVLPPTGCMGKSIANATKVPGRVTIHQVIDGMDSIVYDSGAYENDVSGMTIKIRGNTSAWEDKKPYKIKLEKKADLLQRGDDAKYKDKDWLLIKDTFLYALPGFRLNELLGMPWTPGRRYVNVVLNNDYKGIYLLIESVKRNPDCRINVDKLAGYIFECDPYWWNEDVYVNSITSPKYNFTFKYPDSDDILPEQLEYMQTLVTAYENSLSQSNYTDYIDVRSFAAWCLGMDIEGIQDAGGTNRYYSKYDDSDTTLMYMPVMWDFDGAERVSNEWSYCHRDHFIKLFNNSNRTFVKQYVKLWCQIRSKLTTEMTKCINDFCNSDEGKALAASYPLNNIVLGPGWDMTLVQHQLRRSYWYKSRMSWLDNAILELNSPADTNLDGEVTITDVTYLIDLLLTGGEPERPIDVNGDGNMDISDATTLIDLLLGVE